MPLGAESGSRPIALPKLNLSSRWGGCSKPRPGHFKLGKSAGTHCTEGGVGPRAVLDLCGKSRPHITSNPEPSSPLRLNWFWSLNLFCVFNIMLAVRYVAHHWEDCSRKKKSISVSHFYLNNFTFSSHGVVLRVSTQKVEFNCQKWRVI